MTLTGAVNRCILLLFLVAGSATAVWNYGASRPEAIYPAMVLGALAGFVVAIATTFRPVWSPVTAPIYAILQGIFIGGLSMVMEQRFPGIVQQAVLLTFGVMFALLAGYQTRIIRPSQTFRSIIVSATLGIAIIYFLNLVIGFFVPNFFSFIQGGGPLGIGFSLIVVGIAALNLVLDFEFIESGVEQGAPKTMEWYGAFGLTVTLVWLYIEILRLLSKMRRN